MKYWLPAIIWMTVIFSASSDRLSARNTSRIIGPLLRWLKPDISPETIYRVQFAVRKTAHVMEYAILVILFWRARRRPDRQDPRPWKWSHAFTAFLLAAAYAVTDEFHQSFTPTRQGQMTDVLIDSGGALLGLLALWGLGRFRRWW